MHRSFRTKLFSKEKTPFEIHDKLTQQIFGMRRGKQYEFLKLERADVENKIDEEQEDESPLFNDSNANSNKELRSKAKKKSGNQSDASSLVLSAVSSVAS